METKVMMREDCRFLQDLENKDNYNVNKGRYNLICSIRDIKLFVGGMKPHRHWRFKDVKDYFGLSGGTDKILSQLEQLQTIIKDINLNNARGLNA